jgi:hypothetical protein
LEGPFDGVGVVAGLNLIRTDDGNAVYEMINRCDKKVKFEIELQGDGYTIFKVI